MRTLIALFLSTLICLSANVTNDMREINGAAYNAAIRIQPLSTPTSNGTYMVTGPAKTYVPRSGIVTITNIQPGNYSASQGDLTWYFSVPNDTNTYNFAQLATSNVVIYAYTNGLGFPGLVRVGATDPTPDYLKSKLRPGPNITFTTNMEYITISGEASGGGGAATNIYHSAAGAGVNIETNGLLYTFSVPMGALLYRDSDAPGGGGLLLFRP